MHVNKCSHLPEHARTHTRAFINAAYMHTCKYVVVACQKALRARVLHVAVAAAAVTATVAVAVAVSVATAGSNILRTPLSK